MAWRANGWSRHEPALTLSRTSGRRILIIANPAAGSAGRSRRLLRRLIAGLEQRGCSVVLRRAGPVIGDAERLARDAEPGFDVIAAAGGDGTLNAVASGLAGTSRLLAVLPLGTANVVAHDIGLPRHVQELVDLIAFGRPQPIWPGRIGVRLFLAIAGCGFDGAVVAAVNPRAKRLFGRAAFLWAMLRCLVRYRPCEMIVKADGVEYAAASVVAAKGRCYAGGHVIAPEADLAAPFLELILFRRSGRAAVLSYGLALFRGKLSARQDVVALRCRAATVSGCCCVAVQADGEPSGFLPVSLGVAEQPLNLLRP